MSDWLRRVRGFYSLGPSVRRSDVYRLVRKCGGERWWALALALGARRQT